MRRAHALMFVLAASLPLAGCYYDPNYGYVRNGSGADAYYGEETTVVSPGYAPGYYGGYGYGGCCYSGVSVGTVWYDGHDGRRYRGRDWHRPPPRRDWHDDDHRPGNWQGRHDDDRHDGGRPGGWNHGGDRDDHRPPPGVAQGGGRPPGSGWHGGDRPEGGWQGGSRPAPSAGSRPAPSQRSYGGGRDRSRFRSTTD